MQYQPGKANIVADALSRSRPSGKAEESAQQEPQKDQDAEGQCDQAFAVTSSVKLDESELIAFRDAQQADPVLKTLRDLPEMELQRRNFEISPQGILVKVEDDQRRPVVPKKSVRKSCRKTMMFRQLDMWGSSGRWTWSNGRTGGAAYGVMRPTTCGHVRYVSG